MKNLDKNEWVAVIVSVFVVGFFFIFGQGLITAVTSKKTQANMNNTSQVLIQETLIGGGEQAQIGDRVTVNYTGKFEDGKIFDSSYNRNEPFQFVLGSGQVIKGWDEGIKGMRVGGKRTISVPPELGYGANDYGPIPGGSTLLFDIELLRVDK